MQPSSIAWTRLAQALALAILALNVYRAAVCSITIDEAFTYNSFVRPPLAQILTTYDANHHVLHSLLAKVFVSVFGVSEFTLRLPSLLGGALYLWMVLALARTIFGSRPMLVLPVALLSLNPLVLDYLSMARGYGAGLGLWLLALHQAIQWPASPSPRQLRMLALTLAASVGFNLIFIPPGCLLAAWCAISMAKDRGAWDRLLNHLLIPGVVVTFLILVLPLAHAERYHFYLGEKTLWRSILSISSASLLQGMHWMPSLVRGWDEARWTLADHAPWAAAALMLASILAGIHVVLRARRNGGERLGFATISISWGALLTLIAGHSAWNLPYPYARTGIYWIPLLTLLALWLYARYATHMAARIAGCAVACVCLLLYALQIHPTYYPSFRADAGTKQFVEVLRQMENGTRKIRLGVNWQLETGFNFYRYKYGLDWMAPVESGSLQRPADYYVLLRDDMPLIEKLNLQVILRHPDSEAVLAKPARAQSSP
jgi:uncharacterized membrane protein